MASEWSLTEEGHEAIDRIESKALEDSSHPLIIILMALDSQEGKTLGDLIGATGLPGQEVAKLLRQLETADLVYNRTGMDIEDDEALED